MRLTDLQWRIYQVLLESNLPASELKKTQDRINAEIEKFGDSLVQILNLRLRKNDEKQVGS